MARTDGSPSGQPWGTFLRNHMPQIPAMDLFVVPTISFNLLYVLVIIRLARRELVWIDVTAHDGLLHLYNRLETGGRVLLLSLLCAEAGWLILVNAWLRLERAYLKMRLFLRV
jgi:hypothetical protein